MSADFDAFWAAYPKRRGANPRAPARTSWDRAIKRGASPEAILAGARAYAGDPSTKVGTEFVAQAVTWLNQRRWEDYQAPSPQSAPTGVWVAMDTPQWKAWQEHLILTRGKGSPCVNFGWRFPTPLPPLVDASQAFENASQCKGAKTEPKNPKPEFSGRPDNVGKEPAKEKGGHPNWYPKSQIHGHSPPLHQDNASEHQCHSEEHQSVS